VVGSIYRNPKAPAVAQEVRIDVEQLRLVFDGQAQTELTILNPQYQCDDCLAVCGLK